MTCLYVQKMYVVSMLYVCVRHAMDVVFSVCIVRRGAICARVLEV